MKSPPISQTLRNIEEMLLKENRDDRLKSFQNEINLGKGDRERLWECIRGLEEYLGVQMIKSSKYKKR